MIKTFSPAPLPPAHRDRDADQWCGEHAVTLSLVRELEESHHQKEHVGSGFLSREGGFALDLAAVLREIVRIEQRSDVRVIFYPVGIRQIVTRRYSLLPGPLSGIGTRQPAVTLHPVSAGRLWQSQDRDGRFMIAVHKFLIDRSELPLNELQ